MTGIDVLIAGLKSDYGGFVSMEDVVVLVMTTKHNAVCARTRGCLHHYVDMVEHRAYKRVNLIVRFLSSVPFDKFEDENEAFDHATLGDICRCAQEFLDLFESTLDIVWTKDNKKTFKVVFMTLENTWKAMFAKVEIWRLKHPWVGRPSEDGL